MFLKMVERTDQVWKSQSLAATYLEGVRAAIPLALEQIEVMLRLIAACGRPVRRVLDLGCGDGVLAAAIVQRVPGAEVVLADFSEPMLEAARKRFAAADPVAHFVMADYGVPSWTEAVAEWSAYDAIDSLHRHHPARAATRWPGITTTARTKAPTSWRPWSGNAHGSVKSVSPTWTAI